MPSGEEEIPTVSSAFRSAARLLHHAELETDLNKMDRYISMADSWINMAGMLYAQEHSE